MSDNDYCEICGRALTPKEQRYCMKDLCAGCCDAEHLRFGIECQMAKQCPYHCEQ